jgi:hypothetical protein
MMESGGVPLREWIADRFTSFDARIRSNHDKISRLGQSVSEHNTSYAELRIELRDAIEDIKEMKGDMKWIKRGLFGAIAVGLMFTISVAALIVQVSA